MILLIVAMHFCSLAPSTAHTYRIFRPYLGMMADEVNDLKSETEQLKRQLAEEKAKVAEQQKELVQQASLMKDASDAKPVKKGERCARKT